MSTANSVKNTTLLAMLQAAEKSQTERHQERLRKAKAGHPPSNPPQLKVEDRRTPAKTKCIDEDIETPVKTSASQIQESRREIVPLTMDEIDWLDEVMERQCHLSSSSSVISHLVNYANTEPSETKKKLFLVIRCRRCSAGAKGGVKHDREIELAQHQWQWLENVRERSRHASIGKTLRIILDFYMPLCKEDVALEQKLLRSGFNGKTGRHEDAVASVDPSRALAIKSFGPSRAP